MYLNFTSLLLLNAFLCPTMYALLISYKEITLTSLVILCVCVCVYVKISLFFKLNHFFLYKSIHLTFCVKNYKDMNPDSKVMAIIDRLTANLIKLISVHEKIIHLFLHYVRTHEASVGISSMI